MGTKKLVLSSLTYFKLLNQLKKSQRKVNRFDLVKIKTGYISKTLHRKMKGKQVFATKKKGQVLLFI